MKDANPFIELAREIWKIDAEVSISCSNDYPYGMPEIWNKFKTEADNER